MNFISDFIQHNSGLFAVLAIVASISVVAWACDSYEYRKTRNPKDHGEN